MNLTIHCGSDQIGGSCVELEAGGARVIIDIGLPLTAADGGRLDARELAGKTVDELLALKLLPNLTGLYKGQDKKYDAVLISHAHADHCGLLSHIHPDIPVYMSRGTQEIIEVSGLFTPIKAENANIRAVDGRQTFDIGGMRVTPFVVDHSAFDALAFLVEAGGKKVFYSGDFRGHGRKSVLFQRMVDDPPRNIDCLLMEGTSVGNSDRAYGDEKVVERQIEEILQSAGPVTFLCMSSQNIDRVVSAYKACRRANAVFVVDIYTAYLLDRLRKIAPGIPAADWRGMRICFVKRQADILAEQVSKQLLYHYNGRKIKSGDMNRGGKYLMLLRNNSHYSKFLKGLRAARGAKAVYSMWGGYIDDSFRHFCADFELEIEEVHAGGHASVEALQSFAKALNPRILVPIHTFSPEKYRSLFENVRMAGDGERIEV